MKRGHVEHVLIRPICVSTDDVTVCDVHCKEMKIKCLFCATLYSHQKVGANCLQGNLMKWEAKRYFLLPRAIPLNQTEKPLF